MLYLVSFVVMEDQVFEDSSSSVFVELEYESSLSAGLDTAQYYLSKSVKESTKKQVYNFCLSRYSRISHINTKFFFFFLSTLEFMISGLISVVRTMCQNLEQLTHNWLPVCL